MQHIGNDPTAGDTQAQGLRARLRTPRAAAIAGILFSALLITSLYLLRLSVPEDPLATGGWLKLELRRVGLAINLVPFAGIAFLWFIGVLRDRLGKNEDQFMATVFFGSGLLFLGMMFVAAAAVGALLLAYSAQPQNFIDSGTFVFARAFSFFAMRIYAFKMAAVFMISASTLALRTGFIAAWIAFLGYLCAAFLLFGSAYFTWAVFAFPLWVLLVSCYILVNNFRADGTAGTRTKDVPGKLT
jgi:hypothetical protein